MPLLIKIPDTPGQKNRSQYLNVLDRKKTAVQRHLRREGLGGYEPQFLATILTLAGELQSGFRFYDVGSHIGLYSALVEKLFGAICFSFEPDPVTYGDALQLKRLNNLTGTITQAAVSMQGTGSIELFLSPKAETSNSLNSEFRPGAQTISIPAISLDVFTSDANRDPALVKIDVETFEPEVILGGLEMLRRSKPPIACELLPQTNLARLAEALGALDAMGYRFMQVVQETPWKERSVSDVLGNLKTGERDWLFTTDALTEDFYSRRAGWLVALGACGKTTNLEIDSRSIKRLTS